jgi:adenylylsulfate reductase, subunit B
MSIRIIEDKCAGCGKCERVCPGSLIAINSSGRAYMRFERECWACASCIKECGFGAIELYLGDDIGGKGTCLGVQRDGSRIDWNFTKDSKVIRTITTDSKVSNKY